MKKELNVFHYIFLFVLEFIFSLGILVGSSVLKNDTSRLLLRKVSENHQYSHEKWFSYVTEVEKSYNPLIDEINDINSKFYSNRNRVVISEESALSFNEEEYTFSNIGFLNDNLEQPFSSNAVSFISVDKSLFFKEISSDNETIVVPVVISNKLANIYCENNEISEEKIIGSILTNDEKYTYVISGIWDDESNDHYKINRFFIENKQDTIFVDNTRYKFERTKCKTYLFFSPDLEMNYVFLRYCRTICGSSFEIKPIVHNINIGFIGGYNNINDYFNSISTKITLKTKVLSVLSIAGASLSFIGLLLLIIFSINRKMLYIEKFAFGIFIFNSLVVGASLAKKILEKISTETIYFMNTTSIRIVVILSLLLILGLVFPYSTKEKPKKKQVKENAVLFICFEDIFVRSASSIRVNGYIESVKKTGTKILYVGFFNKEKTTDEYFGVNRKKKIFNYLFAPFRFQRKIKLLAEQYEIKNALVYSPMPIFTSLFTLGTLHRLNINIIHDVCEYQSPSQFNIKKPGWFNLSNRFYNSCLISSGDQVISISNYLNNYFISKNAKSIIIPPLFNFNEQIQLRDNKTIRFSYIGQSGKKDELYDCVKAFIELIKSGKTPNIEVNFYGESKKKYYKLFEQENDQIKNKFIFNECVNEAKLKEIYKNTDYIFFLRNPKKRYSKAGFPSKVIEASFFGVPTITNRTSDLSNYFTNDQNIFFAENESVEAFKEAVLRAIEKCSNNNRIEISNLAKNKFSLSRYEEVINNILLNGYEKPVVEIKKKKILLFSNDINTIINFRSELIQFLNGKDYEVVVISGSNERLLDSEKYGCRIINVPFINTSTSVLKSIKTQSMFEDVIREEKPDIVFTFQIKPNIFGTLAAKRCGINKIYCMAEGLGNPFLAKGFKGKFIRFIVCKLYKNSLKYAKKLFVLNEDDKHELIRRNVVEESKVIVIPGIGIDTKKYSLKNGVPEVKKVVNLSRLIRNKGIIEYCSIARLVRRKCNDIVFELYGSEFELTVKDIQEFIDDGSIIYKGFTETPVEVISDARLLVSTSKREGFPRTILEAMAVGTPVIASNVIGNKTAVIDGETGYLIEENNLEQFANKIIELINNEELLKRLGNNSRKMCEEVHDCRKINSTIFDIITK